MLSWGGYLSKWRQKVSGQNLVHHPLKRLCHISFFGPKVRNKYLKRLNCIKQQPSVCWRQSLEPGGNLKQFHNGEDSAHLHLFAKTKDGRHLRYRKLQRRRSENQGWKGRPVISCLQHQVPQKKGQQQKNLARKLCHKIRLDMVASKNIKWIQ